MKCLAIVAAIVASGSIGCAGSVPASPHVAPTVSAATGRPMMVRAEAGVLWAGAGTWAAVHRAWSMPARGAVEDLAVEAMPDGDGYVVTFRQGGMAWRGELDASREARGRLRMVPETGEAMASAAQR